MRLILQCDPEAKQRRFQGFWMAEIHAGEGLKLERDGGFQNFFSTKKGVGGS